MDASFVWPGGVGGEQYWKKSTLTVIAERKEGLLSIINAQFDVKVDRMKWCLYHFLISSRVFYSWHVAWDQATQLVNLKDHTVNFWHNLA